MTEMKGEVEFEADGKTYTLKFGTNALVKIEQRFKRSITDLSKIWEAGEDGGMTLMETMRTLLHVGLQSKHAEEFAEEETAGDLMDEIGLERTSALVIEAVQAAFPDVAEKGNRRQRRAAASARPRK